MYMLTFIIVVVYGLFVWKQICVQVFIVRLSKYRLWGTNYNINRFKHATYVCLSQAKA
jgi:hypothetical protein